MEPLTLIVDMGLTVPVEKIDWRKAEVPITLNANFATHPLGVAKLSKADGKIMAECHWLAWLPELDYTYPCLCGSSTEDGGFTVHGLMLTSATRNVDRRIQRIGEQKAAIKKKD